MRARAKRRLRALALSLRSVTVTERVVVPCVTRSFARTGVPELTLRAVRESIENVTLLVAAAARLIVRWRLLRLVVRRSRPLHGPSVSAARTRAPAEALAEAGTQVIETVALRPRTESVVLVGVNMPGLRVGGSVGSLAGV